MFRLRVFPETSVRIAFNWSDSPSIRVTDSGVIVRDPRRCASALTGISTKPKSKTQHRALSSRPLNGDLLPRAMRAAPKRLPRSTMIKPE